MRCRPDASPHPFLQAFKLGRRVLQPRGLGDGQLDNGFRVRLQQPSQSITLGRKVSISAPTNFEFQLSAQLGQTNVIETTTNLNTWTSLTSVVVTTVPQPVVDFTASNHPARFYRSAAPSQ